jgi:uncharacterized protein YxjI
VDGKALRLRETLFFEDMNGKKLCKIQERLLTFKDTMAIEDADGNQMAVIKKGLIAPLGDHWTVKVRRGPDLDVQGNMLDLEYSIMQRRKKIAEVSKNWFSVTDTYGVEIDEGQNDILVLAIAIAVDMMSHDGDKKKIESSGG